MANKKQPYNWFEENTRYINKSNLIDKKRMAIDLKRIELKVNCAINSKNILNFDTQTLNESQI